MILTGPRGFSQFFFVCAKKRNQEKSFGAQEKSFGANEKSLGANEQCPKWHFFLSPVSTLWEEVGEKRLKICTGRPHLRRFHTDCGVNGPARLFHFFRLEPNGPLNMMLIVQFNMRSKSNLGLDLLISIYIFFGILSPLKCLFGSTRKRRAGLFASQSVWSLSKWGPSVRVPNLSSQPGRNQREKKNAILGTGHEPQRTFSDFFFCANQ